MSTGESVPLRSKHRGTTSRVLQVLSAFKRADPDLGVTDIHKATGLDKSVVHRILVVLVEEGFLARDPTTSRYRVGFGAWEVGRRFTFIDELRQVVTPRLLELSRRYDASGYMGVLDGVDMVYLVSLPSTAPVRVHFEVGQRISPLATAFGMAALVSADDSQIEQVLSARNASDGDRAALDRELNGIREAGYGTTEGGSVNPGMGSVGVPIHTRAGTPPTAISVAFPLTPGRDHTWQRVGKDLIAIRHIVEKELGTDGPGQS